MRDAHGGQRSVTIGNVGGGGSTTSVWIPGGGAGAGGVTLLAVGRGMDVAVVGHDGFDVGCMNKKAPTVKKGTKKGDGDGDGDEGVEDAEKKVMAELDAENRTCVKLV
ncbi:hypothetical protein B0H14DRAFT_2569298 [Mycena olivaceomarginata]|nr:hypothetical protein B0H14DRAFT_2569298 [Mycena olivaceomarginata]